MIVINNNVMRSDSSTIVYLSHGDAAMQLKEEHPSIYNWVFPRTSLPPGSMIKTNISPQQSHIVLFAADEYGGVKASDIYECFKALNDYIYDCDIDESEIAITKDLYHLIKEKDYIRE